MTDVKINTADGEQWARMYAMALKREQELLAKRDRLREALQLIELSATSTVRISEYHGDLTPALEYLRDTARAALAQGGQDD